MFGMEMEIYIIFPQTPITFIPLSIFYCFKVCSCFHPKISLKFNALKVTIRIDSISYFSLNIQYDWLINILILCYEEPGVVTIEFIHGRALYVWINKMVSLYIITTPITGIEKKTHRLWVGCRNEIFTRLHSLCTFTLS